MENQIEKLNANNTILLVGTILGALISFASNCTVLSIFGGAIGGLIFGALFISFILPHKPSDR